MKIHIKRIAILFAVIIFVVSGCGKADEKSKNNINGSQNDVTQKEETIDQDNSQNNEENQDGLVRASEQNLSFKENEDQKEETAFLKVNENQNYSIYVLPNFELTAEEPQKDILYLIEDDSIFMRIELLPDDIDWDNLKQTTSSQLSAVSPDIQTETSLESDLFLKDSIILEASNQEDIVTSYLINQKDIKLKLTMFNKVNEDHRDAFIQMAKTIMKETPKKE
jgi:hypothetical protein